MKLYRAYVIVDEDKLLAADRGRTRAIHRLGCRDADFSSRGGDGEWAIAFRMVVHRGCRGACFSQRI